jgi:dihydroorotate dehydrogenase
MRFYSRFIRPLAFQLDPETAHHLAIAAGAHLGWAAGAMRTATCIDDDRLAADVAGLHFPNPIGLAAGFDKSGSAIRALAGLGFGSVEIGSISIDPSSGNPKPRLWRLPGDEAIVVHYGLPNDGAEAIAKRLAGTRLPVPLGINLVVTNRGPGAVSGLPAAPLADLCIRETFRRMDRKRHVLIGAGGISTAEEAYAKIRLGASLVQLLTALIYQGPGVVRTITKGLAALLARDGVKNVADIVGVDA